MVAATVNGKEITRQEVDQAVETLIAQHQDQIPPDQIEQARPSLSKQMLENLGYKVVIRTSSIEALALFKAESARFDMVVTDFRMPNMAGDKLARELIQIRPDIPIILCIGFGESIGYEKARELGIRELIMKPLVMRDLAEIVRRVLDER